MSRMNGHQFVETLKQLGYPNSASHDPQMFNWMFENEAVSPFLTWFCSSVTANNILLPRQLHEFAELEKSGDGILEGSVLEDALRSFSADSDEVDSVEIIKQDIARLSDDVEKHSRKKEQLIARRDKLSAHSTRLGYRSSQLAAIEAQAKHDHQSALQELEVDNTEMNESLDGLVRGVTKIHTLYENRGASGPEVSGGREMMFLSHVDLADYYSTEDRFSHELEKFTKKRFFEGVAEMAGQNEMTKYELLEVSNPECLTVRGEKQGVIVQDSKELARLKKVYPISQTQLIEATVSEKQSDAAVTHAKKMIELLQGGQFLSGIDQLRDALEKSQITLNAVKRDLVTLQQTDIPALISRSTDLQGMNIITGDYNLKLARQGYFTSNQDQLIEQLVVQRARNEFLTMAYEVEGRNHRDMHHLLTAVRQLLNGQLVSWQERKRAMDDPLIRTSRQPRGTIDSRDKSTARLHQMLTCGETGETTKQQLFLKYASMVEAAERLHSKHQVALSGLEAGMEHHEKKASILEAEMRVCVDQLYHGSSTTCGDPNLTPPLVQETMSQLDAMLGRLEASIMTLIKDHDSKKKVLKTNRLQAQERDLFTYFFTQPDMLKQTVEQISDRLQAQTLQ